MVLSMTTGCRWSWWWWYPSRTAPLPLPEQVGTAPLPLPWPGKVGTAPLSVGSRVQKLTTTSVDGLENNKFTIQNWKESTHFWNHSW